MYKITQEGKYYLQKGFPERHLLQLLKSGEKNINDIKIDRKEAAIYWAKKNKWVAVCGSSAALTFFGRTALPFQKIDSEKALADLEKRGNCSQKYLKELLSRKLIEGTNKANLTLKLKNIFWKSSEFEERGRNKAAEASETGELKRKIFLQQKAIENLQDYVGSIERRLRNLEERRQ